MYEILTPNQMRDAESASVRLGVDLQNLMNNAGEKLSFRILLSARRQHMNRVVILVGSGNNGGDGLVAANHLIKEGLSPTIILCCGHPKTELAKNAFDNLDKNILVIDKNDERLFNIIFSAGLIVDCVFGTGFHGSLDDDISKLFKRVNDLSIYKIACDVPSGANAYSGLVCENAFKADETVTFHRSKIGLHLSPAKECCGKIRVADIGIPDGWDENLLIQISSATIAHAVSLLPFRKEDSHKGNYGKCMLLCGSLNYPGAAIISSMSALRSGTGIVNLCTPKELIYTAACKIPECTFTPLNTDENGFVSKDNLPEILEKVSKSTSIVVGCGLGKTDDITEILHEIIKNSKSPIIIDADGINCLSEHIDILKDKQSEIILTPHVGELARLCEVSVADILEDTLGYSNKLADEYGVTVHAKNTQTLTVSENQCILTDFGCSALAKGGSGDMLAGLIGSLTAQGLKPVEACVLADYVMGRAARILCESGSARGVLATDIISAFPKTFYQAERGVIA